MLVIEAEIVIIVLIFSSVFVFTVVKSMELGLFLREDLFKH